MRYFFKLSIQMLFLFFSSMNCWLRLRRKLWWFYLESYLVAPARSLISLPLCLPCIRRSLLINRRVSATHKSREEYTRSIFKGGFPNTQKTQLVFVVHVRALAVFLFFKSCFHFIFRGVLISLPSVRLGALCSVRRRFGFVFFEGSLIRPPQLISIQLNQAR